MLNPKGLNSKYLSHNRRIIERCHPEGVARRILRSFVTLRMTILLNYQRCRFKPKQIKSQQGFTLVEVLTALLIVGTAHCRLCCCGSAGFADNTAYLRDKTLAHWVAMNQLELVRIRNQNTNQLLRDELSGNETMAGREWRWRIQPKKTMDSGAQQLFVRVYPRHNGVASDTPVVTLIGFVDRYHQW